MWIMWTNNGKRIVMKKTIDWIVFVMLFLWTIYFLFHFVFMPEVSAEIGVLENITCVTVGSIAVVLQLKRLEE